MKGGSEGLEVGQVVHPDGLQEEVREGAWYLCLEGQKVQKHGLSQVSECVPTWWSGRRKGRLGGACGATQEQQQRVNGCDSRPGRVLACLGKTWLFLLCCLSQQVR